MHKGNAAIILFIVASAITLVLTFADAISGSDITGVFYFPAILLAVILSGGSRAPAPTAEWTAFLAYTFTYVGLLILVYVVLLEFWLLRREARKFEQEHVSLLQSSRLTALAGENEDPVESLQPLGLAMQNIEARRRKHWLLADNPQVDLRENPALVAAKVLRTIDSAHPSGGIIRYIHGQLSKKQGNEVARSAIEHLRSQAAALSSGSPEHDLAPPN